MIFKKRQKDGFFHGYIKNKRSGKISYSVKRKRRKDIRDIFFKKIDIHASKKPITAKEAKWRRSFLRNILERRAVYLKKEGERKKWRKEHREERKERRKKRKKEKEENTLTWGKSKTRKTFIKKQNRINKNR